jgi:hypothetical protein
MTLDDFAAKKETPELEAKILRLEDDLRLARAARAGAEKRAAYAERVREHVFGLKDASLAVPEWAVEKSRASDVPHVPVLITSDFQWGEVIDKENMDGVNEFNVEIAESRYRRLVERTIDLSFEHLPKHRYEGIIVLRLGDTVSGDIHQELRETNELSAIPAVRSVVASETWGLRQLASAFGRVHVVSVPGNHGRYQIKPPSKKVQDNYDTLASWWLESNFGDDARLTWHTPNSIDAVFPIHDRLYLATHGDRIGSRGGEGFIGPAATIMRGMKRVVDEYGRRRVSISKVFVGHFHTAYELGYGWSNGSLPGYSEYARGGRMTPEPALQWLIYFHPRYGATARWPIFLQPEAEGVISRAPFTARG